MLPLVVIALGLGLVTIVDGFLDDCPIDRGQMVDNEQVVGILETFYNDLAFVRASTKRRHLRNYSKFFTEVDVHSAPYSRETYVFLLEVVRLLKEERFAQAQELIRKLRFAEFFTGRQDTYLLYFDAEANRLIGNDIKAADCILSIYQQRRDSEGVSVNDLQRLDGLIALQKISEYNQNVDRMHGLRHSPDYQALPLIHHVIKSESMPLDDLRYAVYDRLYMKAPRIGLYEALAVSYDMLRIDLDDFSGSSVRETSVERILCEFAQKLETLDVSSFVQDTQADYGEVLDQLRQFDPDLAGRLDLEVVANIESDNVEHARSNAIIILREILESRSREVVQEIFATFFTIELNRRSRARCRGRTLEDMQHDLDAIKQLRRKSAGISLDKIIQLEGKVSLLWMSCFHERVKSVYELDGTEDEQQLRDKRRRLGTRDRLLPAEPASDAIPSDPA